jgi:Transglycosylase-like domain
MRTLAVWLALALPTSMAASAQSRSPHQSSKPASPSTTACQLGCHVHHERLAVRRRRRVPLSVRIPRWREWHCIAHFESTSFWAMSPTTDPPSGGAYWGGLQMDMQFMHSYGEDMIRRHAGGLADTWTPAEQITVANRAWQTRGFAPWPTTSRECGLR